MKKILSLSLVLLLALGLLAGCSNNDPVPPEGGDEGNAPESVEVLKILDTEYAIEDYAICLSKDNTELLGEINAALAELKDDGTIDAILAKFIEDEPHTLTFQQDIPEDAPTLTMGTNPTFPPYEYYEGQEIVGIDAEIAAAIADKLGRKLVIRDMEFDTVLLSAQTGSIDIGMAGITVTPAREETMSFTNSYATGVQVIIVRADSPITSVDDLFAEGAFHKIGVQANTTGDIFSSDDIEAEGKAEVKRYNKGAEAVLALVNGQVDCVIIDNEPAKAFVAFHNQ